MNAPLLRTRDFGICDYTEVYQAQKELVKQKSELPETPDTLLFCEHPDVYTFGRKSKNLPEMDNAIAVERGGEATYHNIGQLVVYPILYIDDHDLNLYLRKLEETTIRTLETFGVSTESRKGATGVWLKNAPKKIASIGVALRSWVTYHGVAINVENALQGFSKINPCGFDPGVMTSLKEVLGESCPKVCEVKKVFQEKFCDVFGYSVI